VRKLNAHVVETDTPTVLSRINDWVQLTKLRLASLVSFAAFVGALLAEGRGGSVLNAIEAALWITASAASGGTLNQVLERDTDRLMLRTQSRPLITGRITTRNAILVAALLGIGSTAGLWLRYNPLAALLSLASLFAYVAVYTPLKRVSTLNTVVGALPGAAPPLIGYVAVSGALGNWAISLFAIVFAWQFPHFMSIAWMYREDYKRAGMRMLPGVEGGESIAGRQALVYSLCLLPISMLPGVWGDAGPVYIAGALVLGMAYCIASFRFMSKQTRVRARQLLWTSLIYLPALLTLILCDPAVRAAAEK
jgi:protoheme IX farnesyltransferase